MITKVKKSPRYWIPFLVIVSIIILVTLGIIRTINYGSIAINDVNSLQILSSSTTSSIKCGIKYQFIDSIPYVPSPANKLPLDTPKAEIQKIDKQRTKSGATAYGGIGDPKHLGGFVDNDTDTYERQMWDWAIEYLNITSILDVGCGKGYSTIYFKNHNNINDVHCIEGSTDAVKHSLVPNITIQHDYSQGAYWTKNEYDMIWSAEFLEHVDEKYMANYMSTFKRGRILFVTHAVWGGWHHSNIHQSTWWIRKFEQYGFQYQDYITQLARNECPMVKAKIKYSYHNHINEHGNRGMSHFHFRGLVFFNKLYLNKFTEFDCKQKYHQWSEHW